MLLPFRRPGQTAADMPPFADIEPPQTEKQARKAMRARLRRREKVQRAAGDAIRQWSRVQGVPIDVDPDAPLLHDQGPLLRSLPKPRGLGIEQDRPQSALPPRRHEVVFRANVFRTMFRLTLWMFGALRFLAAILWDKLRGRYSEDRCAWRLRMTFEAMGTTFIKFGQQLSMRLDLLPYAYTRELEKMLDRIPEFPAEEAIRAIERATGRKLDETFAAFDPNPIGSASVACVYQAVLRNGDRVAIKVRRPGIGELLAADMRALSWLLFIAELVVLPPGFTASFMFELRTMLMEELDFIREARFTDLFRRALRKTKQLHYASAPRVYFELSNVEVMVTEFVSGIWLTEILTALETNDADALAKIEAMGIDTVILARRFLLISRFGNFEHIFFHADLHPANILVRPGNKIVLIDFGSCGSFTKRELVAWRRMFDAQSLDDVGGMVQAGLAVIEPLPPIDRDEFSLRLETMFWNDLYSIKSTKSEWWERISARLWIGFLKLAREYGVPMRLNTLRMIRAIMLADTIAARLDHDLDPYREYRFYEKGAGRRAKKRTYRTVRRLLGPGKFNRIEQGIETGLSAIYQIQRTFHSIASIRILPLVGKAAYASVLMLKTLVWVLLTGGTIAFVLLLLRYPHETFVQVLWNRVIRNGYFQLFALVPITITLRRLFFRLRDPEV